MLALLFVPLLLQGLFIAADEIFFHRRRRLPTWEIWGHPLDTLSVAVPFGLLAFNDYSPHILYTFIGLAVFSCVFVTKDEFIHSEVCPPMENWLHAMLFILHPISFLAAAVIWMQQLNSSVLLVQFLLVTLFMIYQILYWGRPWLWFRKNAP